MKGENPVADADDDPDIVAAIRFHNLCLGGQGDVARRPNGWFIDTQNAIGWRRGDDRFVVINKADTPFTAELPGELQTGTYKDVRTGKTVQVQQGSTNQQLHVDSRTAVMFVKL